MEPPEVGSTSEGRQEEKSVKRTTMPKRGRIFFMK